MKSRYHDSLVRHLRSPSMVGGLNRFSPDALMTAVALCLNTRVKPANNQLMLNEIWETEYRQLIAKPLAEIRKEVYVDMAMVQELARQIMTARSWAHKSSMYCSDTVMGRLREIANETAGSNDCDVAYDIMTLTSDRVLNFTPDEREMALAANRMAMSVREVKQRVPEITLAPDLRRAQITNVHAYARQIVELEAQWWDMVESFATPTSPAVREFIGDVFTRNMWPVEPCESGNDDSDRLKVVLDEAFKRLGGLSTSIGEEQAPTVVSMEAFYGV